MENKIEAKDIYLKLLEIQKLMVTHHDIERLYETLEIVSDAETKKHIELSERDLDKGSFKEMNSVALI